MKMNKHSNIVRYEISIQQSVEAQSYIIWKEDSKVKPT